IPPPTTTRPLVLTLPSSPPPHPPTTPLFPYTTLFRSQDRPQVDRCGPVPARPGRDQAVPVPGRGRGGLRQRCGCGRQHRLGPTRSEEHTSELQSRFDLVCRLLLEKKDQTSFRTGRRST